MICRLANHPTERLKQILAVVVISGSLLHGGVGAQQIPVVDPDAAGFDSSRWELIKQLVTAAIAEEKMPGCVICFGRQGKIAFLEAYGQKQVGPSPEVMTSDTVFDLASLTKPVATATSVMKLVEDGQLRLDDTVTKVFPEFGSHGKDEITVKQLLIHQSGLTPDNALSDYDDGADIAWQKICELELVAPVGTIFKYSDVNFIVLAKIVEQVSGKNVHEFSQERIFQPLSMLETGYVPSEELRKRAAPTEMRDGQWMQGEVHDPRAYRLDGIAGHAGLFSTAHDLAIYARMMLGGGTLRTEQGHVRVLSGQTFRAMTRAYDVSSGVRGLGWDKQTGYSSNRGDLLSPSAFGHGGFTGTVLWIDPELDLFFIFLSNRVHPDGKGAVNHLAGQILNVVASSLRNHPHVSDSTTPIPSASQVLTGIDVLKRDNYRQLASQRIGLITNHTGRSLEGESTVRLLHQHPDVQLIALFSPEHGIAGQLDIANIGDSTDPSTGLKIHSLYGATRRPTSEMLQDVDTLVFDIQDIGCRFYTYISTMGEAMQAAAENGKRFVVLDRPNPIGGIEVQGPMLDSDKESFVGFHHLPVRHGMTIGELAMMFRAERNLDLNLTVIECEGWRRDQCWDQTNLIWINPSPNMRSLTQALLYPGIGLLETTNLSVGRGTDTPFEVIGAPWIDHRKLVRALQARAIPGVAFVPIEFTPSSSNYAGELCRGVNFVITDWQQFDPIRVGLEVAVALRRLFPDEWQTDHLNRLLGNDRVCEGVVSGKSYGEILPLVEEGLEGFRERRDSYLLYR